MTAAAPTAKRFSIRRGQNGWERWDNFADEWQALPFQYLEASDYDARLYASGRYGVPFRQVRIERAMP